MSQKISQQELICQIADLSIALHQAHHAVKCLKVALNNEYSRYFRVNPEPEPNFRGIRWDDPRYEGVIKFTAPAYGRLCDAKRERYNAKRRLDKAVSRLIDVRGVKLRAPKGGVIRRATAQGETLQ